MESKIAKVSHIRIRESVQEAVSRIMELADYRKFVRGSVFLKLNLLSLQVVPGQCTSPYVLEGILKRLREDGFDEIYVGDANVATVRQVMRAAKRWGVLELCKKYGIKFVNLSKEKRVKIDSKLFGKIGIPKILLDVDSIVSVPVLKTHNVAEFTCSLKNQWGCLPEVRHNYHLVLDKCIPEINKIVKPCFSIVDASICMEGSAPVTGKPIIVDSVFASNDLVALDSCCADIIGINRGGRRRIDYVKNAEKSGLGNSNYEIVGDPIKRFRFKPGIARNHPIVFWELVFRRTPVLKWFLFKTPFFKIPAFIASRYNSFFWYNLKGKRYARDVLKKSKIYEEEFGKLI